jgi:tRNA nucleotidyltransferase (CCA-adding enzyme)
LDVQASAPQAILMGRHLIELGMEPGRDFGVILDAAYEAQLEGKFFAASEALRWLAGEEGLPLPVAVRQRLQDS